MGATHPSRVTPLLPESYAALTPQDVAAQIKDLGEAFEGYADKVVKDGLDGAFLQNEVTTEDLPDIFKDLGVSSTVHQKKLAALFRSFKSGVGSSGGGEAAAAENDGGPSAPPIAANTKRFAGFLSHFKHECGTEARLVQVQLKPIVQANPIVAECNTDIFLDSDDLSDLRNLLNHVKESHVLVLLQSKGVLTRPWVIMELHTAITNDVPIVALNVQKDSCPYDYAAASDFLLHFDQDIDIANPGAAQLLIDTGIDPVDVAWRLSDCLPNIIRYNQ